MVQTQRTWMYGGAILLALISGAIALGRVPSIWLPMPIFIIVAAWTIPLLLPLVTPMAYLGVLKLSSSSRYFEIVVLCLVLILAFMNILYFHAAWDYGTKYQGLEHTRIVALQNLVGFGVAIGLSTVAVMRHSRILAFSANLLLFATLSWCAFPYLGELP